MFKTREQIEHEKELEAKARYQLRTLEDGQVDPEDKTLLFESRFESGNLYLAQKVTDNEYNLLMQNDINTNGHTQWFFFQVKNTRKSNTVKFNIMNFTKPDSLFNFGMKVCIYSQIKASGISGNAVNGGGNGGESSPQSRQGWFRGGEKISYFCNSIKKDVGYTSRAYYTLTFTYTFQDDDDVVYFAYCYPYSYSDLMSDIYEIESDAARRSIFHRKTLCKTLAGVDCEILSITQKDDIDKMEKKKAVVISARVHPGEVVGSWMMRGVLRFLTDPEDEEARMLRENYVFKIIPMLNPDGVINGNYRCSLAGCDLNRRWKFPHKAIHPTIFFAKKMIKDLHKERGLVMYCDLHGHSRKQNVFMYGCHNNMRPEETRVFPLMLSKLSKFFDFTSCRFGVQKAKESTARISMYKELVDCPNIFTLESTFSGVDQGELKGLHMNTNMFEGMGRDLCRTLLVYQNIYIPKELEHIFPKPVTGAAPGQQTDMNAMFAEQLKNDKKLIAMGDGDSSGGSDSEPSEDNLPLDQAADIIPIMDKKDQKMLQKIRAEKKLKEQKEKEIREALAKKMMQEFENQKKQQNQEPPKSPTKRIVVDRPQMSLQKKEEKKDDSPKKKPQMKDAWTQTERSDLERIKRHLQQQHAMQEMREQQRFRAQHGAQMKSTPGQFKESAPIRKAPQSQTRQREMFGINVEATRSPIQVAGIIMNERNLKDLREQNQQQVQNLHVMNLGAAEIPSNQSPNHDIRYAPQNKRALGAPRQEASNLSSRIGVTSSQAPQSSIVRSRNPSIQQPTYPHTSGMSNQRVEPQQQRRSESVQQIMNRNQGVLRQGQIMQKPPAQIHTNEREFNNTGSYSANQSKMKYQQQPEQPQQPQQPLYQSGFKNGSEPTSTMAKAAQNILNNVSYSTISMPPNQIPDRNQSNFGAHSPLKIKQGSFKSAQKPTGWRQQMTVDQNNCPIPNNQKVSPIAKQSDHSLNVIDDYLRRDSRGFPPQSDTSPPNPLPNIQPLQSQNRGSDDKQNSLQQSVSERMFRQLNGRVAPQQISGEGEVGNTDVVKNINSPSTLEDRKRKLAMPKLDTTNKNNAFDYFSQVPTPIKMDGQTSPFDSAGRRIGRIGPQGTINMATSPFKQALSPTSKIRDALQQDQDAWDDSPDQKIMRKNLVNWRANEIQNAYSTPMLNRNIVDEFKQQEGQMQMASKNRMSQLPTNKFQESRPTINLTSPNMQNPQLHFPPKPRPSRKSLDYPVGDIQSLHQPLTMSISQQPSMQGQMLTSNTPMPQHVLLQAPAPKVRNGGGPYSIQHVQHANTTNPSLNQYPSRPTLKMDDDSSVPVFSNQILRQAAQKGNQQAESEAHPAPRQTIVAPQAAISERQGGNRNRVELGQVQDRFRGGMPSQVGKSNFFNISPRGGSLQQQNNNGSAVMSAVVDDRYAAVRLKPFAINDDILHNKTPNSNINNGIGSHGQFQLNQNVSGGQDDKVNKSWVVLQASSINQESVRDNQHIRSQLVAPDKSPVQAQFSSMQIRSPGHLIESQSPLGRQRNMFMNNLNIVESQNGAQQFARPSNNLTNLGTPMRVMQGGKPSLASSSVVPRGFHSGGHRGPTGGMTPSTNPNIMGDFSSNLNGASSPTKHFKPYLRQAGLSPLLNQGIKNSHKSPPHSIRVNGRNLREKRPTPGDVIANSATTQQQHQIHFSPPAARPQNSHSIANDNNNNRNVNRMKNARRDQQFKTYDHVQDRQNQYF